MTPHRRANDPKPIELSARDARVGRNARARRNPATEVEDEHDFILRFWDWFEPRWVDRLCAAWDLEAQSGHGLEAARSLDRLRRNARGLGPRRARASPPELAGPCSSRRIASSKAAGRCQRSRVAEAFDSGRAATRWRGHRLRAPRPADVREWVMGLWTERLSGRRADASR